MPRRSNPWPAFVDLFSALLTVTFAGFIMMSSAYQVDHALLQKKEQEKKEFRERAVGVKNKVKEALRINSAQARDCGDDLCIDLYFHFELNDDKIVNQNELASLATACAQIKSALDTLPATEKKDLGLVIEGHTDSKQANFPNSRERERFNWNLSAQRATSVLYEFRKCGLKEPDYQIIATGFADTLPLAGCNETPERCDEKNRRTTLRLHADTAQIEGRLGRQTK
ncbi:MAG TPA: OmpA family protein [Pyrinomonadaceae bacterium]|nr:OmpA family protein [Pyrinomonadaceae bacterium]